VPHGDRRLLAVGDFGDNQQRRSSIQIYFVALPEAPGSAGQAPTEIKPNHRLELTYPDGPRDCEAMAYDASSGQILLLTKRDKPPRLYGVGVEQALDSKKLELQFLGATAPFRAPTRDDMRRLGKDAAWISQPTGLDINADASMAAVITYRSLYLFSRQPGETWAEAFSKTPREFLGPISRDEEAIAFDSDMAALLITTEGLPAPIYRVALP
jgi:hypothetical protein